MGSRLALPGGGGAGALEAIVEPTDVAGVATFALTDIPQDYRHLRLITHLRLAAGAAQVVGVEMTLNGDAAANYVIDYLRILSSVVSGGTVPGNSVQILATDAGAAPGHFGTCETLFIEYSGAVGRKTAIAEQTCYHAINAGYSETRKSLWQNTAPITRIDVTAASAYATGSFVALYGMR